MVLRKLLVAAGACVLLAASAQAQQWPTRTVKVVVPYGAGGVTDTMARVTADRLGKALGQNFIIENKLPAEFVSSIETRDPAAMMLLPLLRT